MGKRLKVIEDGMYGLDSNLTTKKNRFNQHIQVKIRFSTINNMHRF